MVVGEVRAVGERLLRRRLQLPLGASIACHFWVIEVWCWSICISASDEWSPTDAAPIGGAYGDAYTPGGAPYAPAGADIPIAAYSSCAVIGRDAVAPRAECGIVGAAVLRAGFDARGAFIAAMKPSRPSGQRCFSSSL